MKIMKTAKAISQGVRKIRGEADDALTCRSECMKLPYSPHGNTCSELFNEPRVRGADSRSIAISHGMLSLLLLLPFLELFLRLRKALLQKID